MKNVFTIILLIISTVILAQNKPGNNLGKTWGTMITEFPNLRYVQTNEKGDVFQDGYGEDGISAFFCFSNGVVIQECLIVESTNGFSKSWYDAMCNTFMSQYPYAIVRNTYNSKIFDFGDFLLGLFFSIENGKETTSTLYSKH